MCIFFSVVPLTVQLSCGSPIVSLSLSNNLFLHCPVSTDIFSTELHISCLPPVLCCLATESELTARGWKWMRIEAPSYTGLTLLLEHWEQQQKQKQQLLEQPHMTRKSQHTVKLPATSWNWRADSKAPSCTQKYGQGDLINLQQN